MPSFYQLRWGLTNFLPWLALHHSPHNLYFPSSWIGLSHYTCPAFSFFQKLLPMLALDHYPPTSTLEVAGITGMYHHWLLF
jgi:hypothetical protein